MRRLINKILKVYFYFLFLVFILAEAIDIITIMLCSIKVLTLNDVLYVKGFLGAISSAFMILTIFTYITPLCINNFYPFSAVPDVLREVNFNTSVKYATNIPLAASVVFSFFLLIIIKPFNDNQEEFYDLLWMMGLFQPLSFKAGIYNLLWSKSIKK